MKVTILIFSLLAALCLTLSEATRRRRIDFRSIKRLPVSPAGHFYLNVSPREISPGLTEFLTVNCTFSLDKKSDMPSINSLIVSKSMGKENQQEQFVDLATLHLFAPDHVNRIANETSNVSGHIDDEGESFLSIKLSNPTANESGLFRCRVNGIDTNGHPKKMYKSQFVTSQQPNLYQLRDDVNQLQRQFERLQKLTRDQLKIISEQKSQLDFQTALLKPLNEKFKISSEYRSHYYLLSKDDWQDATEAVKTCQGHGLYLAEINDESEFKFLSHFFEECPPSQECRFLVSGTYEKQEGHWIYQRSGIKLKYANWDKNKPRNKDGYNCIIMKRNLDYQWKWDDAQCTHDHIGRKFVCELEPKTLDTT